jgi:dTDP-4-dehydrorhamnose reductase
MEILLTGNTDRLGGALLHAWSDNHEVHTLVRDSVDFRYTELLWECLEDVSFDALVNCISMLNPEDCELWPAQAYEVNTEAPGILAEICQERGTHMVHLSTDYVLDGETPGLKDEKSPCGQNTHAASRW